MAASLALAASGGGESLPPSYASQAAQPRRSL